MLPRDLSFTRMEDNMRVFVVSIKRDKDAVAGHRLGVPSQDWDEEKVESKGV